MRKKVVSVLCCVVMAAGLIAGCGGKDKSEGGGSSGNKEVKIGVVTGTGGLGDKNMNDAAYEGLCKLKDEGVEVQVVEPEESSDFANLQTLFAETGEYAAVFCVTTENTDALTDVSAEFPDQKFVLVDSEVDADNVTNVMFRSEETGFQLGVLAGLLEKENALPKLNDEQKVGFVGGQDNPIINQFAAGYKAGVLTANPDAEVEISFVGSFSDPSKATEISNGLYENGCDIVFACAGGSGLGVFTSAEKMDGYAFGIEVNQNDNAPDNIIASGVRRWDKIMTEIGKEAVDGTLEGETRTFGLAEDALEIDYEGSNVEVSDEVKKAVDGYVEKVASGEYELPTTVEGVDAYLQKIQ